MNSDLSSFHNFLKFSCGFASKYGAKYCYEYVTIWLQIWNESVRIPNVTRAQACGAHDWVDTLMLQVALKREQIIVEEKKVITQALIESIGQEKSIVDDAVDSSRADEEAAAMLSVRVANTEQQKMLIFYYFESQTLHWHPPL